MKYLTILLLFLSACAHGPMLESGACYRSNLPIGYSSNEAQFFTSFKIIDITTINSCPYYTVQPLDFWGDPIHPGTRYTHNEVALFDEYIAPIVYKFNFDNPNDHVVKCNPLNDRPTLNIVGRKP